MIHSRSLGAKTEGVHNKISFLEEDNRQSMTCEDIRHPSNKNQKYVSRE